MRRAFLVVGGFGWAMLGGVSVSFKGIPGSFKMLNGPLIEAPKSGLSSLRYRVYQLRSTLSRRRFVSRLWILFGSAPVAALPSKVRNRSRLTGSAPLEIK